MSSYTINGVIYTMKRRGLEDSRSGWRSRLTPFTSMLAIEYFPGEKIQITLIDKSILYITVEDEREKLHLKELYRELC
jgi:hypothetical protein